MPPTKKNILFYIGALEAGGAERVLIELLKHLNSDKYHLSIVVNRPQGFFFDKIPKYVNVIDRSSIRSSYFDLGDRIFGLSKIIRQEKADLVVAIMASAGRSLLRTRFLGKRDVKMAVRIGQNPTRKLQENKSWFWSKLESLEIKHLFPKSDAIIAISEGIKKNLLNDLSLNLKHVQVIHNPVNLKMISQKKQEPFPISNSYTDNHNIIVAAGRLVPQKGYDVMLPVFRRVREQMPAKLIILGSGKLETELKENIRKMGLENDVHMAGFVENPWAYFNRADLYLSTSIYEGFHLTIAEAMACGVVPVATDCDYGPREILTDGENGRLVPVNDVNAISDAVIDLLKNSDKRKKMAQSAANRAKDFDVSLIIKQYENLIDSVLEKN